MGLLLLFDFSFTVCLFAIMCFLNDIRDLHDNLYPIPYTATSQLSSILMMLRLRAVAVLIFSSTINWARRLR